MKPVPPLLRRLVSASLYASAGLLPAGDLRRNEIQVVGTHNAYHVAPDEGARAMIGLFSKRGAEAWDYSRETLDKQWDRGLR